MAVQIQIGWQSFKAAAIKDFITRSHIDIDTGDNIAEVIVELTNLGFEPRDFLNWSNSVLGAPIPPNVRPPKPTLAKQGANEPIDVFLDRVNIFFRQSRVAQHDRLSFLLDASLEAVRRSISYLSGQDVTEYDVVCTELRQAFLPSRTVLQSEFSAAKRTIGESFSVFGQRLTELYRRILKFEHNQMVEHAPATLIPLLGQLLKSERRELCGYLNQEFDKDRHLSFKDLCIRADTYDQSHSFACTSTTSHSTTKPAQGTRKFCSIHKKPGHWTSECFLNSSSDQQPHQQRPSGSSNTQWNRRNNVRRQTNMLPDGRTQAAICSAVEVSDVREDSQTDPSENDF
jgi:hypothetical protein